MQSYSTSFLTDSYLKYIGWTLHDKVRVEVSFLLFPSPSSLPEDTAAFPGSAIWKLH